MKAAGRFASRKPVSKGPSRPGAVIINSLVTVVPPCGRPVTIITGGPARSDVSNDFSSALAAVAIRRTAHAKRRRILTITDVQRLATFCVESLELFKL